MLVSRLVRKRLFKKWLLRIFLCIWQYYVLILKCKCVKGVFTSKTNQISTFLNITFYKESLLLIPFIMYEIKWVWKKKLKYIRQLNGIYLKQIANKIVVALRSWVRVTGTSLKRHMYFIWHFTNRKDCILFNWQNIF